MCLTLNVKNFIDSVRRNKMKKLLVLALVLSMASMANAGLTTGLSVSAANTSLSAIGQSTTLSISNTVAIPYLTGGDALVVVEGAQATIDWGTGAVAYADSGLKLENGGDAFYMLGGTTGDSSILAGFTGAFPASQNGMGVYAYSTDAAINPTTLFNSIKITSNAVGNAVVTLYYINDDFDTLTQGNSVTITTVPEPMTMCLLGLGGLFLRRRK